MIATSTIVAVLISVLGGATAGALSRQPEINRLKAQVRKLQAEVERLQNAIRMQDRQIKQLLVQYKGLKAYQFNARNKARNYTRGALIFQYAYKEYLGLLMRSVDTGRSSCRRRKQFSLIYLIKSLTDSRLAIVKRKPSKEYILYRYKTQIDNLQECDCNGMVEKLRDYRA